MGKGYNVNDEIDPQNALQQHKENKTRCSASDWDECDEDYEEKVMNDGLDSAFLSWEQANGMFYCL